jgi:hypothetical protein
LIPRRGRQQWIGVAGVALGCGLGSLLTCMPPAAAFGDEPASASPSAADSAPVPLRVAPESESGTPPVDLGPERPAWVESRPVLDGEVHQVAVKSDYHAREHECRRALDQEIQRATREYLAEYLGDPTAPMFFPYSLEQIKQRCLSSEHVFHEVVQVSFGPMHQVHALLEFRQDFRAELEQHWRRVTAAWRLLTTAGIVLCVLAVVGVAFSYLRLDTATRGYYTRRLQFLAVVAILTVVVVGVWFARSSLLWVRWLI